MSRLLLSIFLLIGGVVAANCATYQKYDKFLKQYVCENGVDYDRIKKDNALDAPVNELINVNEYTYNSFSEQEKIAYLINVYLYYRPYYQKLSAIGWH